MVNNWGGIGKGVIAELTRNRRTAKKPIKDFLKNHFTSLSMLELHSSLWLADRATR